MFHPLGLRSQMTVCDPLCPAGNAWGVGGVNAARLSVLYVCMHRQVHRVRTKTIDAASDTGDTTRLVSSWLGLGVSTELLGAAGIPPNSGNAPPVLPVPVVGRGGPNGGGRPPPMNRQDQRPFVCRVLQCRAPLLLARIKR